MFSTFKKVLYLPKNLNIRLISKTTSNNIAKAIRESQEKLNDPDTEDELKNIIHDIYWDPDYKHPINISSDIDDINYNKYINSLDSDFLSKDNNNKDTNKDTNA